MYEVCSGVIAVWHSLQAVQDNGVQVKYTKAGNFSYPGPRATQMMILSWFRYYSPLYYTPPRFLPIPK